MREDPSLERV